MIPGSPGSYGQVTDEHGNVTRWGPLWILYAPKGAVVQVDIIDEDKEVNCPIKWTRKDGS